jgi:hypothetical protein
LGIRVIARHWSIKTLVWVGCLIGAGSSGCAENEVAVLGAPELVLSEMRLGGTGRIAERIDSDVAFGRAVMNGIATGDSLWLEVARELPLKSATAEASFVIALATALPRRPDEVLDIALARTEVDLVCGIPFLDSTAAGIIAYHEDARDAVARARAPSLVRAASRCGIALDSARERKLARIDPSYIVKNKPAPAKPAPRRRRR